MIFLAVWVLFMTNLVTYHFGWCKGFYTYKKIVNEVDREMARALERDQ